MGETIRAAGLRAVKQKIATTWTEVQEFLRDWKPDPYKVIVKPSAASCCSPASSSV